MNTSYTAILVLLYLTDITGNNIHVVQLLSTYGSNTDIIVNEVRRIVTTLEENRFRKASFVTIVLPPEDDNTIMRQIVEEIVRNLSSSWLISTSDSFCCDRYVPRTFLPIKPMVIEHAPDFYIIPLRKNDGLNYLNAQLNLMSEEKSFNPKAIFLLVAVNYQCGDFKDNNMTNPYFNLMWGKNCMSLVILSLECDFQTTIITATPYSDNNVCRKVQENGTIQYHSNWTEEGFETSIYERNHKNFNKCQFSVGTIHSPPNVVGKPYTIANVTYQEFVGGIDIELLRLVSTIHNFTYVFDVHHGFDTSAMTKILPNGSLVGIFQDVLANKIDISIGGIIPFDFNYYRYQYSYYFMFSSFVWAVSDTNIAPQWKIFFGAFSQDVWIISSFVFLVSSFLYSFLDRFIYECLTENHNNRIENLRMYCNFQAMPLIQYFSITLGLSSRLNPKSSCLRVLYFSWSIYSLHMCIAYSSMLFLLISNPPLEKEIKTVEDLRNSGLKVGSKLIVLQRFKLVDFDSTTRDVMDASFVCPTWESCMEDLIKYRNFSLLIGQGAFDYYFNTKLAKIHRITEAFFSYGTSILTSKGSPLSPGFDKLTFLVLQSGLAGKWERDTKLKFKGLNVNDGSKDEKNATILTVNDLKGTFLVLVGGIVISSLLFCGELVVSFLQK